MNNKYSIFDLNKGLFADYIYIYAKSPLEAVRKYALEHKIDPQSIVRDYEWNSPTGRFVVTGRFEYRYGKGYRKYVYKTIER